MNYLNALKYVLIFVAAATFFNDIMDTIAHHPESWVVQICPEWMRIRENWDGWDGLRNFADGWHTSKTLMQLMFVFAIWSGLILGYHLVLNPKLPRFAAWLFVLCALTYLVTHFLFYQFIFKL